MKFSEGRERGDLSWERGEGVAAETQLTESVQLANGRRENSDGITIQIQQNQVP